MQLTSRPDWGSLKTNNVKLSGALPEVYIHHLGAGHSPATIDNEQLLMRNLQTYARNTLHYTDVDYNFIIGASGVVYEGRGLGFKSAATLDRNSVSRSVCLMGNFQTEQPTPAALQAAMECIKYMIDNGDLTEDVVIRGHRDNPAHVNATACPGTYLYANIDNIRAGVEALITPPAPPDPVINEVPPCTLRVEDYTAVFLWHADLTMTWVLADQADFIFSFFGQPHVLSTWENLTAHGAIVGVDPGQV